MPTYPDNDAVTTLVAAALFAPSPTDLLAQATTLARSSTHRQLVAIASAYVAGDADRVRVLASRPCLRSSRRRPRHLDGSGGHPDRPQPQRTRHEPPDTTKRRFGVIGTRSCACSAWPACSIDASNQTRARARPNVARGRWPTTSTSATPRDDTGSANDRGNRSGDSAHRRPSIELVQVGDGRLHVRCVGAGDTTVVLIAGFNDGGDNWGRIDPRPVPAQPGSAPTPASAPAPSDPPTTPQTFATSARDLHTLLAEIGEPGPYVVVGHSYGGAQAVTFAAHVPGRGRRAGPARRHAHDVDRRQLRRARRRLRSRGRLRRPLRRPCLPDRQPRAARRAPQASPRSLPSTPSAPCRSAS